MEIAKLKFSDKIRRLSSKRKAAKEKKAEEISAPRRLARYVAVAEYVPQESGDIALQSGVTVEVLEKSDSGKYSCLRFSRFRPKVG